MSRAVQESSCEHYRVLPVAMVAITYTSVESQAMK
jgi:hypothetical protein